MRTTRGTAPRSRSCIASAVSAVMSRPTTASPSKRICRGGSPTGSTRSRSVLARRLRTRDGSTGYGWPGQPAARDLLSVLVVLRGILLVTLLLAASCAKKPAVAPVAVGAPHFPEFVFPAAPAGVGSPEAAAHHADAWRVLQAGDAKAADRGFTAVLKEAPAFYPAEAALG